MSECWGGGTATLMLMGDMCSRACRFCMVTPGRPTAPLDPLEPDNVAFALSQMDLNYVVLTSVDRDDVPDGGASHFARTIHEDQGESPGMMVEVLIPDFQNDVDAIQDRGRSPSGRDCPQHRDDALPERPGKGPPGQLLAVALGPEDGEEA